MQSLDHKTPLLGPSPEYSHLLSTGHCTFMWSPSESSPHHCQEVEGKASGWLLPAASHLRFPPKIKQYTPRTMPKNMGHLCLAALRPIFGDSKIPGKVIGGGTGGANPPAAHLPTCCSTPHGKPLPGSYGCGSTPPDQLLLVWLT